MIVLCTFYLILYNIDFFIFWLLIIYTFMLNYLFKLKNIIILINLNIPLKPYYQYFNIFVLLIIISIINNADLLFIFLILFNLEIFGQSSCSSSFLKCLMFLNFFNFSTFFLFICFLSIFRR